MKILLISGHGAGDPGAVAKIDGRVYREADLTREVVANLKPLLEQYGAKVDVYPTARNAFSDTDGHRLDSIAKFQNYDYVLEVHFNSAAKDTGGNGYTTGVECFWPSRATHTGVELPMTSRLAKLGFRQRQNRAGVLAVINTAAGYKVNANLLEVCFIDDADDMRLYLKNKKAVAQAIANGIAAFYKLTKEEDDMVHYTKVEEVPAAYRPAVEALVAEGSLGGFADERGLWLSEDLARFITIWMRHEEKKKK